MEDEAEMVDDLMTKYSHLSEEQRARIKKLTDRDINDKEADIW